MMIAMIIAMPVPVSVAAGPPGVRSPPSPAPPNPPETHAEMKAPSRVRIPVNPEAPCGRPRVVIGAPPRRVIPARPIHDDAPVDVGTRVARRVADIDYFGGGVVDVDILDIIHWAFRRNRLHFFRNLVRNGPGSFGIAGHEPHGLLTTVVGPVDHEDGLVAVLGVIDLCVPALRKLRVAIVLDLNRGTIPVDRGRLRNRILKHGLSGLPRAGNAGTHTGQI